MKEIVSEINQLRFQLHQIAEVSGKEEKTALFIENELKKCQPSELKTKIGGEGLFARFDSGKEGKHIVFRSELDALPIQEVNTFEHRSNTEGVSHKCGHDGHMSILLGVAKYLHQNPLKTGSVSLLFQPAEESGQGAKAMLDSGVIQLLEPIDMFYSLHNIPGHSENEIHCRAGIFTPHVISLEVKLIGKESHAAEPENGINPATAISEIIQGLNQLQNLDKNTNDFKLITPVFIQMGQEWYGISAGNAVLGYTIRTWETAVMRQLQRECVQLIERIGSEHNLQLTTHFFEEFNSVVNDPLAAEQIEKAAQNVNCAFKQMTYPMNWGEDYGLFTQKYRGAMFGLGAGTAMPALHNPDYDFPDQIAESGIKMFVDPIHQNDLL